MTACHQPVETIVGNEVPAAWFANGLRVIDIANPLSMKQAAWWMPDVPAGAQRVSSNDVYVDHRRASIYLIDRNRGLSILGQSSLSARRESGSRRPARPNVHDPRVFRVFRDRGSAPRSRPWANAKGTASWALLRGLPYRLGRRVERCVLPARELPEAGRRNVAARRAEDGAHAVELTVDRVAVDHRLPPISRLAWPACRCGPVPVRRHRRNARHSDHAPSKPHAALAGLPENIRSNS